MQKFLGQTRCIMGDAKQRFHPFYANPRLGIFKDKKERKGMLNMY